MNYYNKAKQLLDESEENTMSNPLYETFQKITAYCDKIEELNIDCYKTFPPTTPEAIAQWEATNNAKLPEGYKNWLLLSNGFRMNTTAEISSLEGIWEPEFPDYEGYYRIGEYIGDGSMLLIDKEGNFYEDDHCFGRKLSSFEKFLEDWIISHLEDEIAEYS